MPDLPLAMLAELTHRCPLMCPYCSNPQELTARDRELTTEQWADVFRQAADLGVLQLHLSGGEPASRRDLVELVIAAREAGLYTNLITSGIGLTEARLEALNDAGLDHIQLSVQGVRAEIADRIGGYKGGFDRKMQVADHIARLGFPLTLNAVMHRDNLDDLPATIAMAERLGARRIEIACVQFQGWALANRARLQPTRAQVDRAKGIVRDAVEQMKRRLVIDFVPPDYYSDLPKACMSGWGSTGLNVTPDGTVLPCHAAQTIPHLIFERVTDRPLAAIWHDSPAFNAYRGTDWMPDLCRSCDRREVDFGGCRCQALAILGDASAPDPVCRKSPGRAVLDALLAEEGKADDTYIYRRT
ncbi:pyrroloquinoline quinone biosynthesis protein PqqE [Ruegeria marina]|uniref:PqqA peptide cyclase n=1 Tax=Ruegeria marina TaxID=639004 RepID=A0A1G6ZLT0_9RHOB|nr:pyrroloquinoline quinone biosynthesis protein PqqE [Ruegeria marina]SDE03608.1 pyrroloquinoline quinone biosynthesis protein E [Ruegeria marina]